MRKLRTKGFTLIELLVVIAIIGILAVFTLAFLQPARAKGRDSKRKSDLNGAAKALELYYSDNNSYPTAAGVCTTTAATNATTGNFTTGMMGALNPASGTKYLTSTPVDPTGNATNGYYYCATAATTPQGYFVAVHLENANDPQRADTTATGASPWFRYCGGDYVGTAGDASGCSK